MDLSVRQIGLDVLRQLGQYPELGQLPNFDKRLEQFRKRFEDDEFRIAVIGEFSSGKSTFINALIGRDLLSHASSETTAAITRLVNVGSGDPRCGRCQVKLRSGKVIQLNDLDQLRDYTTAQSQRFQVVQEVESVELWLPFLPETSRPIVIVDTPGLNGIAEGHQEQTLELVGQAHACIFLLPRRGLDEVSLGFLRLLTNIQCNFIFVQNFIDDLSAAEGDTLEQVLVKQTKILNETFSVRTARGQPGLRASSDTASAGCRRCRPWPPETPASQPSIGAAPSGWTIRPGRSYTARPSSVSFWICWAMTSGGTSWPCSSMGIRRRHSAAGWNSWRNTCPRRSSEPAKPALTVRAAASWSAWLGWSRG